MKQLLFLLFLPAFGFSQITISGKMTDRQSGETLLGATIEAPVLKRGTVTNEYGFYSFTLPESADSVLLKFSYLGYETGFRKIKPALSVKLDLALDPIGSTLNEVIIRANTLQDKQKSSEMSITTIDMKEVKNIPVVFGEADILKALQLKPGFTPGTEGTTGLYVRGGANDQNLIILDEAVVYNPNHLFGFFSTFSPDAVKDLKVYKGGFPAQYGGRLSSVIDVRMKEGNNQSFEGSGGLGLIASRLTLEGPIEKNKSSFLVSGRRTYVDIFTRAINKKNKGKEDFNPIPDYYFYDLNTKVNFKFGENDHLFLSGYFGRDKFGFNNEQFNFDFDWGNATGTARWNHIFSPKLFSNLTATFSDYRYEITNEVVGFSFSTDSKIRDANLKYDLYYAPNERHTMRFGGNATFHEFIVGRLKAGSDDGKINFQAGQTFDGVEMAGYFNDEWRAAEKLKISLGARLSAFTNSPAFYGGIEPRLSANYSMNERLNLKASYARMKQYVHLISSSGLSLPTDIWYPSSDGVKPQNSDQVAAGFSYLIGNQLLVTNEYYYKWMRNQIELIDGAQIFANDNLENEFAYGRGWATGAELEIEKKEGKLTGWVGYQFAIVKRGDFPADKINQGKFFYTGYDTRHIVNVVAMYKLNRRWSFSGTFTYQSGYAKWLPNGRFTYQGVEGENFQAVVPVFGERNSFRLPYYLRMDAGLVWKFFPKWGESDLTLSIYNATDRRNPFFLYLEAEFQDVDTPSGTAQVPVGIAAKQVSLFPILPTVTWNFAFGKSHRRK